MAELRNHPQTVLVKESILANLKPDERGRVRLSEPLRRQREGRIVVENFESLCVNKLIAMLPRRSRVFSRATNRGGSQVVLSRLDIYYPLDTFIWRARKIVMLVVWVLFPIAAALAFLLT
jgi:hypothetical protein